MTIRMILPFLNKSLMHFYETNIEIDQVLLVVVNTLKPYKMYWFVINHEKMCIYIHWVITCCTYITLKFNVMLLNTSIATEVLVSDRSTPVLDKFYMQYTSNLTCSIV